MELKESLLLNENLLQQGKSWFALPGEQSFPLMCIMSAAAHKSFICFKSKIQFQNIPIILSIFYLLFPGFSVSAFCCSALIAIV